MQFANWLRLLACHSPIHRRASFDQSRRSPQQQFLQRLSAPVFEPLEPRLVLSALPTTIGVSVIHPTLISESGAGPSYSTSESLSSDGRYVAFASDAPNLVPGDTNNVRDVFVFDRVTGTTTRVSTDSSGIQGNYASHSPVIDIDRSGNAYVAFVSEATNFIIDDTNFVADVFVKNLRSGVTTCVSTDTNGQQGNDGDFGGISLGVDVDGNVYVAFATGATNLVVGDFDGANDDVFVKSLNTGVLSCVSTDSGGAHVSGPSVSPSLAIDAHGNVFVAFQSDAANLVSGDTNFANDVFVKNMTSNGTTIVSIGTPENADSITPSLAVDAAGNLVVAFVSESPSFAGGGFSFAAYDVFLKNLSTGVTTLVSSSSDGTPGLAESFRPSLGVDSGGNVLVAFESYAENLNRSDNNGTLDIFVKNMSTGVTTLVSTNDSGVQANTASLCSSIAVDVDGHIIVAFHSDSSGFSSSDHNDRSDVFIKNASSGTVTLASHRAFDLPATMAGGTYYAENDFGGLISPDGRQVFFSSASLNLVPDDTNSRLDIFAYDLQTGSMSRVSTTSGGAQGNGHSKEPAVVADANGSLFVAFTSDASNLIHGDTNGTYDVFVKELATGSITRVSTDSNGSQANGDSVGPAIAIDGTGAVIVAYYSNASNLVNGDTNSASDVFVTNLRTRETVRVSSDSNGRQANNSSMTPAIGVNASGAAFIAFASDASNLSAGDTNDARDIFVKSLTTGVISRASTSSVGSEANGYSRDPSLAVDARGNVFVAFTSNASNLVATDSNSSSDVFVKNLGNGVISHVSTDSSGVNGFDASENPSLVIDTRDNVFVAFESDARNLVVNDSNSSRDVFLKNMSSGVTTRISTASGGFEANNDSHAGMAITDINGNLFVAFTSRASNLVSGDTNLGEDLFLRVGVDTVLPTVAIDLIDEELNAVDRTSLVRIEFSEPVVGLAVSDFMVGGGGVSNLTQIDADSFTAVFRGRLGFVGVGSVGLADGSYADVSGNGGKAGMDTVSISLMTPVVNLFGQSSDVVVRVESGKLVVETTSGTALMASAPVASVASLTINGGPGVDTITVHDSLNGSLSNTAVVPLIFTGNGGNDVLNAGACIYPVQLIGGLDDDWLIGGSGNDQLDAGPGNDRLNGGCGNDTLNGGEGTGDELVVVTEGNITLTSSILTVVISGSTATDQILGIERANVTGSAAANRIDLSGFVGLQGPTIKGAGGNDTIVGSLMDDEIITLEGRDSIDGLAGNDRITSGSGNDIVSGGDGHDTISSDAGNDVVSGDAGNDSLTGSAGADAVSGGNGLDTIYAGTGNDTLDGGSGNDLLNGQDNEDLVLGADGDDLLWGGSGNDTVHGGLGADTLDGTTGDDRLFGQDDNDSLIGGDGLDSLDGGPGADTLRGDRGADTLLGQAGSDSLSGSADNDLLDGGDDADMLSGDLGHDIVRGGNGDDRLSGSLGNDQLDGGAGFDFVQEVGDANVVVVGTNFSSAVFGTDTTVGIERLHLYGGNGNNLFDARAASFGMRLFGQDGNDTLLGSASVDSLVGGNGDDVLSGGLSKDVLDGGAGTDFLYEVADTDFVLSGTRLISSATGNETLVSIERVALVGGVGNNRIDATQATVPVILLGGAGNDTLLGGTMADVLLGGSRATPAAGTDSLVGNAGADTLDGDAADARTLDGFDSVLANVLTLIPSWIDAL